MNIYEQIYILTYAYKNIITENVFCTACAYKKKVI